MGLDWKWPCSLVTLCASLVVIVVGVTAERNENLRTHVVGDILVSAGGVGAAIGSVFLAIAVFRARQLAALTAAAQLEELRVSPSPVSLWGLAFSERARVERWRLLARSGEGFRLYAYSLRRSHGPGECITAIGFLSELADGALAGVDTGLPPAGRTLVEEARAGCVAWAGARVARVWTPAVEAAFGELQRKLERAYNDLLILAAQRSALSQQQAR